MYERILVPTDGSPTAEKGLTEAINLAVLSGGSVHLIHVVDVFSSSIGADGFAGYAADVLPLMRQAGQVMLARASQRVRDAGVEVLSTLSESTSGRIADLILAQAASWHADLIVIGTHGRRGVRRLLLGSDAEQILRQSPVPVLLVRGE